MDLGMSIGPLLGWGIVQFKLPLPLIFTTCSFFYLTGFIVSLVLSGRGGEQKVHVV
jgi:hypothetical protein